MYYNVAEGWPVKVSASYSRFRSQIDNKNMETTDVHVLYTTRLESPRLEPFLLLDFFPFLSTNFSFHDKPSYRY